MEKKNAIVFSVLAMLEKFDTNRVWLMTHDSVITGAIEKEMRGSFIRIAKGRLKTELTKYDFLSLEDVEIKPLSRPDLTLTSDWLVVFIDQIVAVATSPPLE